jgi:hypothetical protein
MYSGEYDACDVTLSVYPHRAGLKNMPDHGGNRTYDLWKFLECLHGEKTILSFCFMENTTYEKRWKEWKASI